MTWARAITKTVDFTKVKGGSNLTDFSFPLVVSHAELKSIANGGMCRADGFDAAPFSDTGCTTMLKFTRVFYDPVAGLIGFWVKGPSVLAAAATAVTVGYGNAAITTDLQDRPNSFIASAAAAIPVFGDGTTLQLTDHSGNFTLTNGGASRAAGLIGDALSTNGSSYAERLGSAPATAYPLSVFSVFKPAAAVATTQSVVGLNQTASTVLGFLLQVRSTDAVRMVGGNAGASPVTANGVLNTTNWHSAGAVWTSDTNRRLIADGAAAVTSAVSGAPLGVIDNFSVGTLTNNSTHGQFFNGLTNIVIVYTAAMTDGWMQTLHEATVNYLTFTSQSAPFTVSGNTAPTAVITGPTSLGTYAQGAAVPLTGTGNDAEDGALTGSSLAWSSSIDGALGTGTSLSPSGLSLGTHTISLTPTDSAALAGTPATITIVVATAATAAAVATGLAFIAANGGNSVNPGWYDRRVGISNPSGIAAWDDALGAYGGRTPGPQIAQATVARRLTLSGTQGSGSERLTFASGTDQWMASAADSRFDASLNAALYIFYSYKATADGPVAMLAADETSSTVYPYFGCKPLSGNHAALIGTAAAGSPSPTYGSDTNVATSATRRAGGVGHEIDLFSNANIVWRHFHAGKPVSRKTGVTRATPVSLKLVIGRLAALRGTGEIDAIWVTTQRPTRTLIRNWWAHCRDEHGATIASAETNRILFPADSLGYGSQSSSPMTPADGTGTTSPSYVAVNRVSGQGALSATGYAIGNVHQYNYGISGDSLARINTDFEQDIAVNDDGTFTGRLLIILRGIGNYVQGTGPSLATMQALAATMKGKADALTNAKLIWTTEIDRGTGTNGSNGNSTGWHISAGGAISAYGQRVLDFNAWLRDPATYALAGHFPPIDSALVTQFVILPGAGTANSSNVTYYADGTHLTDAGYALLGGNWKDYLDANPSVLNPILFRSYLYT